MSLRKDLGDFIAAARKDADLTQAQLAHQAGVSLSQVSRWELGKNVPTEKNLERLVEVVLHLCGKKRQQAYQLYAGAIAEEAGEKVAASRRDVATMRQELREALDALGEATEALAILNQFVVTYQAFHAAYEQMGLQIDQLVQEQAVDKAERAALKDVLAEISDALTEIKRAVFHRGRPR